MAPAIPPIAPRTAPTTSRANQAGGQGLAERLSVHDRPILMAS